MVADAISYVTEIDDVLEHRARDRSNEHECGRHANASEKIRLHGLPQSGLFTMTKLGSHCGNIIVATITTMHDSEVTLLSFSLRCVCRPHYDPCFPRCCSPPFFSFPTTQRQSCRSCRPTSRSRSKISTRIYAKGSAAAIFSPHSNPEGPKHDVLSRRLKKKSK